MALNKTALQTAIVQAFNDQRTKTDNPEAALADLASKLASAIDTYVKSGTVTTTVTGTSVTGGAVSGTGTGNIN